MGNEFKFSGFGSDKKRLLFLSKPSQRLFCYSNAVLQYL